MSPTDLNNLPAPLTPADCNLQDFAFMPLDVARLRDSDMAAYESPEACWAAVLLWAAAWHQVPAASLPDDDRFLAKAAGYGRVVKEWANVRDGALHGWIKCADGRLYHPVVAEKALESWKAKVHHAWKKECDRIRKANKQREAEGRQPLPFPAEPTFNPVEIPEESSGVPLESRQHSDGSGERANQADGTSAAATPSPASQSAHELSSLKTPTCEIFGESAAPPESHEIPTESTGYSDGISKATNGNPLENALKGQGEGQGQGELKEESTSHATTSAGPARTSSDDRLAPPLPTNRCAQIALLLRAQGVQATSQNPIVAVTWAQNARVTDEVLNVAIAKAKTTKGDRPIPLGYLVPIVEQELQALDAPPPAARPAQAAPPPPPRKPQGNDPKGTDESYDDWQARVEAYERAQRGRAA